MVTASPRIHSIPAAGDAVVLRLASADDTHSLRTLAALDSAAPLTGDVILAERAGAIAAALELDGGRVVADPFTPTAGLVALLQTRAALLRGSAHGNRRRTLPLLQRARSAA